MVRFFFIIWLNDDFRKTGFIKNEECGFRLILSDFNMRSILFLICIHSIFLSCTPKKEETLFKIRNGTELGIDFQNTITTNDTFNAVTYEYIYNGSGVGVGDFNNDGLSDLFFGGNQVSSRLYLNTGKLSFRDITRESGLVTDRWVTGVSVVDINSDGYDDIYLCISGKNEGESRRNLLFINQGLKDGVPVFTELSKVYGLDDESYSTMASFFDYDKDGDLDLYLVNNWLEKFNRNNLRPKRIQGEANSTDRLYRNNGDNTFTNVSKEAGILIEGYGLGVNISDINDDSWPDVYVSNDFLSNDLIWINQQDGTFKNMAGEYLKHQTHNGMGVDIADFNNDALVDILEVDMLPPDHKRQKLMTPGQNYDNFHMAIQLGYQPQYMRNTLQLNRGKFKDGRVLFSEIAFMAGVAKTDWSWAPLFADFDNDGWKDIFIGNGYRKDVTNLDFIFFGMEQSPFGTEESKQKKYYAELDKLDEVKTTNHVFRNTGSLVFEDKTVDWGIQLPTYSNGTVYADFDNDGDLDIATNNIDQKVILYENRSNNQKNRNHFIRLVSKESDLLNQKIWVYLDGDIQYQELTPYRGFQSSVAKYAHFGLGQYSKIDSILIQWPNGAGAKYYNVQTDTVLIFSKADSEPLPKSVPNREVLVFEKIQPTMFTHHETSQSEIKNTRTLLHELSRYGPCLASGDVNGDKLDDFFIGGEVGTSARLFIQQRNGSFSSTPISKDSTREDGGALFFDADIDGDLELYVAGASASSSQEASIHQLFRNNGTGEFSTTSDLPAIYSSASCIESTDYDGDGDLDLFVGGRIKPNEYPLSPRSYVLRNDNGKFIDVTAQLNAALETPGIICSAAWADVDHDQKPDLVLAGEWMPIRIFKNNGNTFKEVTAEFGLAQTSGWWNCIRAKDINHDGYVDIVGGNTGKNSYFQPSADKPVTIIAKDFDKNGSIDPIVSYFNPIDNDRFIVHNRLVIIDQIPSIKKRFETFTRFASMPMADMFTKDELSGAFIGNANSLESILLVNNQGKSFSIQPLPEVAQFSTINDLLIEDVNADGNDDLVLIGNNFSQETLYGRYDASLGTLLLGDGKLHWKNLEANKSGFIADGDAKYIRSIRTANGKVFIIANNNNTLDGFRLVK